MKNYRFILSLFIIAAGVAISYAVAAQTATSSGIEFPIPELGNCTSRDDCRDYCDEPENMAACAAFAKTHGLMNEDEAKKAAKFAQTLRAGGGPGGCRTPQECQSFCSNVANIETCIAFAEKQGFKEDKHLEEGKKILSYIQSGGTMPGGCTSKESCEAYCSDFAHAEECFAFAEKAGLTVAKGAEKIPEGQFQRFIQAVKNNETPGQCKSKNECESYCRDSAHFEECVAFGEKLGFVKPEQAELIRKTGGKGPGGCSSRESCEAYCNEPANHETCFKFAEEHGLIPQEELERAKEGLIRMKQGLENAPPEVAACLKSVLGPNVIEDIQAGRLTPGPGIGEKMRTCFEKFGESASPRAAFNDAQPEVLACLREKFGDTFEKIRRGETPMTPETADSFRICFQKVQFERPGFVPGSAPSQIQGFLRTAPPTVQTCLKEKLGTELQELEKGNLPFGEEVTSRIKACFEEFRPSVQPKNGIKLNDAWTPPGGVKIVPPTTSLPPNLSNLPPEVLSCIKETVGVDVFEKIRTGETSPEIGEKVKICLEKLRSVVPPPTDQVVCIQVITPAYDPNTGVCKEFPTPCDVPTNWIRGCSTSNTY